MNCKHSNLPEGLEGVNIGKVNRVLATIFSYPKGVWGMIIE